MSSRNYTLKRPSIPTLASLQSTCDEWNARYPIGTDVKVYRIAGDEKTAFLSKTKTVAEVLSGHTAVVWLEGVSGCYGLTFVKPISKN